MKVEMKELSPLKRLLKVEIPEEVVSKKFAEVFSDINKRIQMPGFRQGKVPIHILERRFGDEAKGDVVKSLIPHYYEMAVKDAGIIPVVQPRIENLTISKNAPLSFTATVEIRPKFELGNCMGIKLTKKKITVTDEDVDKVLKAMQEFYGELVSWEDDHITATGDYLIIDFEGFLEDKPLENGKADGFLIRIGDKVLSPDFEEQLKGRKRGDEFEIKVEIPEGGRIKVPIPGQPLESVARMATFKVKIKEVKRKELPDIDEEFAKDASADSLAELKERIRKDLLERREKDAEISNKNILFKHLVDMHTFELPPSLVELEIEDMIEGTRQQILQSGKTPEEVGFNPEVARREFEGEARNSVKGALILEVVADKEGITAQAKEMEDEVRRIAEGTKRPTEEVRRLLLLQEGAMDEIKARIIGKKVLDFVYSTAIFEEEAGPS